ncbi:MAG: hypothetical protein LUD51_00685 [Clostridia bacterium]|nr:hypothetical protein [Clostridia bacterium]
MDSLETYIKVLRKAVDHGEISVPYIKQNYPIGYNKACRIIDWMAENGYIEKGKGYSSTCKTKLTLDQFLELYGEKN